ncbi:hypothetical protein IQ07DRAFT_589849 [Pyrenochaeta sp. DS3sAY3a]|nr:hypothetical protein IQ07DRAFT_589849 [Pyrenochaeta sp. DS3sAY3a]
MKSVLRCVRSMDTQCLLRPLGRTIVCTQIQGGRCQTRGFSSNDTTSTTKSSNHFRPLGPLQCNVHDLVPLATRLKHTPRPEKVSNEEPRYERLVERIRKGGLAADCVINIFARPGGVKEQRAELKKPIEDIEAALSADRILFDNNEKTCLPTADYNALRTFVHKLKTTDLSDAKTADTTFDPILADLISVLRDPESTVHKIHAQKQKVIHLTEALAAERLLTTNLAEQQAALHQQLAYLSTRLKNEERLRADYSDKESRVLAHAAWSNIAWALTLKFLDRAPRKLRDWTVVTVATVVAAPFVVGFAAVPIWIVIGLVAYFTPVQEFVGDGLREEVGFGDEVAWDGMGMEGDSEWRNGEEAVVPYNHGLIDLLGWVVVGAVLGAPILLGNAA